MDFADIKKYAHARVALSSYSRHHHTLDGYLGKFSQMNNKKTVSNRLLLYDANASIRTHI